MNSTAIICATYGVFISSIGADGNRLSGQSWRITTDWRVTEAQDVAVDPNAPAQVYLGLAYESGTGVERDDAQAAVWFRRAADANDSDGPMAPGDSNLIHSHPIMNDHGFIP